MPAPLLQFRNHDATACGNPDVDGNADDTYIGDFESSFGEQWVFNRDQ